MDKSVERAVNWVKAMKPADLWGFAMLVDEACARFGLTDSQSRRVMSQLSTFGA